MFTTVTILLYLVNMQTFANQHLTHSTGVAKKVGSYLEIKCIKKYYKFRNMKVCTQFCGNPSIRCQENSLKSTNDNLLVALGEMLEAHQSH